MAAPSISLASRSGYCEVVDLYKSRYSLCARCASLVEEVLSSTLLESEDTQPKALWTEVWRSPHHGRVSLPSSGVLAESIAVLRGDPAEVSSDRAIGAIGFLKAVAGLRPLLVTSLHNQWLSGGDGKGFVDDLVYAVADPVLGRLAPLRPWQASQGRYSPQVESWKEVRPDLLEDDYSMLDDMDRMRVTTHLEGLDWSKRGEEHKECPSWYGSVDLVWIDGKVNE